MPGAYKNEKYEIKICETLHDFDPHDPLFSLTGPIGKLKNQHTKYCSFCQKSKEPKFCDFCGERACDKCLHKQKYFAKKQRKGRICKTCDNKFYMFHEFSKYSELMYQEDQRIENFSQQLHELEQDALALQEQVHSLQEDIQGLTYIKPAELDTLKEKE